MKKFLFILLIILLPIALFSKAVVVCEGEYEVYSYRYDKMVSEPFTVEYNYDNDVVAFGPEEDNFAFILSGDTLPLFQYALEKFLTWYETAEEKEIKLNKEIPNSRFSTPASWKSLGNWYSTLVLNLRFTFVSESTTKHQLRISSNEAPSLEDKYERWQMPNLYFSVEEVQKMAKEITLEHIQEKILEQESLDSIFY